MKNLNMLHGVFLSGLIAAAVAVLALMLGYKAITAFFMYCLAGYAVTGLSLVFVVLHELFGEEEH
jgi:polyferredoxin